MSLLALAYISRAVNPMSNDELKDMLLVARKNNKDLGITGMLLYRDEFFIQAIEGEKENVITLYKAIQQDKRHYDITLLYSEPATKREFEQWSMGFNIIDDVSLKSVEGFSDFLYNSSSEFSNPSDAEIKSLLLQFKANSIF